MFSSMALAIIYLRVLMILGLLGDPFVPFENLVCAIVFGGMWEAYQRVRRQDKGPQAMANGEGPHHKVKKS